MQPIKYPTAELLGEGEPKHRWITRPIEGGWSGPVISEWELTGESWTDHHPHDEYVYVLEGRLLIEADSVTVEAGPGDMVCVPAGAIGRYWAPEHARMLSIYGPNPEGKPSRNLAFQRLI